MKTSKNFAIYICVFVLFAIYMFSADYIFNVLIATEQEAMIVDIELPVASQCINFNVEKVEKKKLKWKDVLIVSGWIFKKGVKNEKRDVYLVLKGKNNTLIFDIEEDGLIRPDVTRRREIEGNVHNHGFSLYVLTYWLKEDVYQIGFVIEDETGKYYHNSNRALSKANGGWTVTIRKAHMALADKIIFSKAKY